MGIRQRSLRSITYERGQARLPDLSFGLLTLSFILIISKLDEDIQV